MTVGTNTLRLLMEAGLEGDALLAVVSSIEADIAPKQRSGGAERQARYRARKAQTVTNDVTGDVTQTVTSDATRVSAAHVEDNSQTSVEEPQDKKQNARRNDLADFRTELSSLDTERLESLVKHRRAKKGQLTGHAARLFRRDADACGLTLSQAVDTCISRNWITVKPEWLTGNQRAGPNGQTKPPQLADVFRIVKDSNNGRQEREDRSGAGGGVSYLPAVGSR